MMEDPRTPIQKSFENLPGYNCFACASPHINPNGLHLVFKPTPEGAISEFTLPKHFQSYPGFIHGGVIAAILDECLGYAGIFRFEVFPITRTFQMHLKGPIQAGVPYRCIGRMEKQEEGALKGFAEIQCLEKGRSLISASGDFAIFSLKQATKLMGEGAVNQFAGFFKS